MRRGPHLSDGSGAPNSCGAKEGTRGPVRQPEVLALPTTPPPTPGRGRTPADPRTRAKETPHAAGAPHGLPGNVVPYTRGRRPSGRGARTRPWRSDVSAARALPP